MGQQSEVFSKARQADLCDVIEQAFGKPQRVGGSIRWRYCPHCGDGGKGSQRLSVRYGSDKYKCFACGESGDVIDFVAAHDSSTPLEAATKLSGGTGVEYRQFSSEKRLAEEQALIEKNAAVKTAVSMLYSGIYDLTLSGKIVNKEAFRYLAADRYIGKKALWEAMERKLLMFLPNDPTEADGLIREICGVDLLEKGEIIKDRKKRVGISYRPIVLFSHGGNGAEFRIARSPNEGEKKALRYGGAEQPWFWKGEGKECVVTEGCIDLLSQAALGWKGHIIGLPSSNNYRPRWFKTLNEQGLVDRFIIRLDNDAVKNPNAQVKSGNTWANTLSDQLSAMKIDSIIDLPAEGDVNDQLKAFRLSATPNTSSAA